MQTMHIMYEPIHTYGPYTYKHNDNIFVLLDVLPLGVGPGLPRWEDGKDAFVKRTGSTSCPGALKLCAFKSQRLAVETVIDVERDVCSSWFEKIKLLNMDKRW